MTRRIANSGLQCSVLIESSSSYQFSEVEFDIVVDLYGISRARVPTGLVRSRTGGSGRHFTRTSPLLGRVPCTVVSQQSIYIVVARTTQGSDSRKTLVAAVGTLTIF